MTIDDNIGCNLKVVAEEAIAALEEFFYNAACIDCAVEHLTRPENLPPPNNVSWRSGQP